MRLTSGSNHTLRPPSVEPPCCLSVMRSIGAFVTILPCDVRPLTARSAKSLSKYKIRLLVPPRTSLIVTTSASPLGLAVKYSTLLPGVPRSEEHTSELQSRQY